MNGNQLTILSHIEQGVLPSYVSVLDFFKYTRGVVRVCLVVLKSCLKFASACIIQQ